MRKGDSPDRSTIEPIQLPLRRHPLGHGQALVRDDALPESIAIGLSFRRALAEQILGVDCFNAAAKSRFPVET